MQLLASHSGRFGEISIMEEQDTGFRWYLEGGAFQSYARAGGDSRFAYVHVMAGLLAPARRVLVLGCGGGTLATMLHRGGAAVTVVDRNPASFDLARRWFWMPEGIRCVAADFHDHLMAAPDAVDAMAIDVGGDSFEFHREFDAATCRLIREALPGGAPIVLNMIVAHDFDPGADAIAMRLAGDGGAAWVIDQTVVGRRNAIVVAGPRRRPRLAPGHCPDDIAPMLAEWRIRPPRPPRG